jgi:hypothetical protein
MMKSHVIRANRGPLPPIMSFAGDDYDAGQPGKNGTLRMTVESIAWSRPQQRADGA